GLASPEAFRVRTILVGSPSDVDSLLGWIRTRPVRRSTVVACARLSEEKDGSIGQAAGRWLHDLVGGYAGRHGVRRVILAIEAPDPTLVRKVSAACAAAGVQFFGSATFRERESGQVALDAADRRWLDTVRSNAAL